MILKNTFFFSTALIIVLTACIVSSGCSSTQSAQTSVQSNSPTITTPTLSLTTVPGTTDTTLAPTTAPTAIISTTATPITSGLTVTINSAVKKTVIGKSTNNPGNIFLVLDVTIQTVSPNRKK